jgi:hypothetical protein
MLTSASDQELLARQAALQAEAAQVLAQLGLRGLFGQLAAALALDRGEEPVKVGECPSAWLPASEPACDAVVQRVQPGGATSPCVEPCWLSAASKTHPGPIVRSVGGSTVAARPEDLRRVPGASLNAEIRPQAPGAAGLVGAVRRRPWGPRRRLVRRLPDSWKRLRGRGRFGRFGRPMEAECSFGSSGRWKSGTATSVSRWVLPSPGRCWRSCSCTPIRWCRRIG